MNDISTSSPVPTTARIPPGFQYRRQSHMCLLQMRAHWNMIVMVHPTGRKQILPWLVSRRFAGRLLRYPLVKLENAIANSYKPSSIRRSVFLANVTISGRIESSKSDQNYLAIRCCFRAC